MTIGTVRGGGRAPGTVAVVGLGAAGLLGLVAVVALAVRLSDPDAALAAVIALTWCVAGLVGVRTRAPRPALLWLVSVGALHLVAFAITGWLVEQDGRGVSTWLGLVAAQLLYAGGFAAIAVLLATYPTGRVTSRSQRLLVRAAGIVLAAHLLQQALFSTAAEPVTDSPPLVPTPWPVLGELPVLAMPALLVLVAAGVGILVARGRREAAPDEDRRVRSWAAVAGLVLLMTILASPGGEALLGATRWSVVFLVVAGTVPFLLLAGLARWRLTAVDRYALRLLSRGLLLVVVLTVYAVAAAVASRAAWPLAALVTIGAALLGAPALRTVERWGDRWLTAGRVRAADDVDELTHALTNLDPADVGHRTTEAVRVATGTSWCRLTVPGLLKETSGQVDGEPLLSLPLRVTGRDVGLLECGSRPGGWASADVARLEQVASHAALALRDVRLTAELADRVSELAASRGRLVVAEETVRRRVERDLHDGLQQQLVALLARLEVARHVTGDRDRLKVVIDAAHHLATDALHDLRALTAGIHPTLLADRGLVVAVRERAAHLPIPVAVDADPRLEDQRFAPEVEGAAYFVVAEALTNVLKHSGAECARVVLTPLGDAGLRVSVTDEGSGAACYDGTGLTGLRDRVDALGGSFSLVSTPGGGTTVLADLGDARAGVDG